MKSFITMIESKFQIFYIIKKAGVRGFSLNKVVKSWIEDFNFKLIVIIGSLNIDNIKLIIY